MVEEAAAPRSACSLIAGGIVLVATVIFLDGERLARWVGDALGTRRRRRRAWTVLQFLLAAALLVALGVGSSSCCPTCSSAGRTSSSRRRSRPLLWIVATLLFRLYVQHFGSYNKTYGTIGGVIMLLTWMYYSMFVVLVGGELASELHHGTGATEPRRARSTRADRLGLRAGHAVARQVDRNTRSE